jgi:mannose-6-phosphate isomerase-like protein (cupin superfamily)
MEKHQVLSKKIFKEISDTVDKTYDNFILDTINDHCLRISIMQTEYQYHFHSNTDELFIVLEGELKIEIRDNDTVFLRPGEFINIPAKTIHKTSAATRTVSITFERNADDTTFFD